MNIQIINKNQVVISRIAILIIFLALIRCIAEPFRLAYYSTYSLTFIIINPYIIGALTAAMGLLIMSIFSFFGKHKFIIAFSILTIILLLIIKRIYLIP